MSRAAWVLALALALAIGFAAAAAADPRVSKPGDYEGYTPKLFSGWARSAHYVPVRDGTRLAVTIYRPAAGGRAVDTPFPVLFAYSPYGARVRQADGTIKAVAEDAPEQPGPAALTAYGYVVVVADTRGKAASFGTRRGFQDRTEAHDAADLIAWLARQPWSNGTIGMWGCSYYGGTQYHAASLQPPSLKAIFPGCTDFDKFDFVAHGGLTAQFNTRPEDPVDGDLLTVPMDEDAGGALLKAAVEQHRANTPMAPLWHDMPYRDSVSSLVGTPFWQEASVSSYIPQIEASGVAIYRWGNFQDEGSAQAILADRALTNPGKLILGPGSHCQVIGWDLIAEERRFFDHYLKGVDNGIDREPHVYYYTEDAPKGSEWRFAQSWPLPDQQITAFNLQADGGFSADAPAQGSDRYAVDYSVSCPTFPMFWPCPLDAKGETYTSPPLAHDLQVTGHPIVHLWLSADAADADVFAYLEEIGDDSKPRVITHGRLRASYRKLSKAPYDNAGLPYHSGLKADAEPLTPGQPTELVFDLLPTSKVFKAGRRMRLVITGADPRQRDLQPVTSAPVLTIWRGGDRRSYVDLPVIPAGG